MLFSEMKLKKIPMVYITWCQKTKARDRNENTADRRRPQDCRIPAEGAAGGRIYHTVCRRRPGRTGNGENRDVRPGHHRHHAAPDRRFYGDRKHPEQRHHCSADHPECPQFGGRQGARTGRRRRPVSAETVFRDRTAGQYPGPAAPVLHERRTHPADHCRSDHRHARTQSDPPGTCRRKNTTCWNT